MYIRQVRSCEQKTCRVRHVGRRQARDKNNSTALQPGHFDEYLRDVTYIPITLWSIFDRGAPLLLPLSNGACPLPISAWMLFVDPQRYRF